MEINKNVNFGNASAGRDLHIGDITNFIDGLSFLLSDYKQQLNKFNELILSFKPKTALDLLEDLENRINQSQVEIDDKIKSKLLYLKALCKNDLPEYSKEDSSKDFVKSYNLNNGDDLIRNRACVEYLNLDKSKAIGLAEKILESEEYNITAWYVKTVTSKNIKEYLTNVPKIVLENYNYQHSIIYQIIRTENLKSLNDLKNYGLQLVFNFNKYKEVSFNNKEAWIVAIDLLVNKIFNDFPLRYISGDNFIIQDVEEVSFVVKLINIYVDSLDKTEISDSTKHQKFYLNYFNYLNSNDDESCKTLDLIYNELEKPHWFYTYVICQVLNHKKEFQKSLDYLIEYETLGGELHSEFYLFKSVVLHLLSKNEEIDDLYQNYLDSIEILDERHMFNIINAFFHVQKQLGGDKEIFENQLNKVLKKSYRFDELKILLEIIIKIRYIERYNAEDILSGINEIKDKIQLDINCKNLIADNLDFIGKTNEAIQYMDSYIDKTEISETLRLYIILVNKQLHNKDDSERERYKELLELLEFWRLNSKYVDEYLLGIEHNLYAAINDFEKLRNIDEFLYRKFPHNEQYLYFYLVSLERLKDYERINELSKEIGLIQHEELGVYISGILARNQINLEKAFEILYDLSKEKNNFFARKNYFASSNIFKEFFIRYEEVQLGNWVVYKIDNEMHKIQVSGNSEIHAQFIGRKIGDKFSVSAKIGNRLNIIEIVEIFNDGLNLFREISNEAKNPLNELGFISIQAPENIREFEEILVKEFGTEGSEENRIIEGLLDDYNNWRIGYTDIVRGVFKEDYVDAYLRLTNKVGGKFTTLPNKITQPINKEDSHIQFALDFSTLLLFYFLDKEFNFNYIHKFKVSYYIQEFIENQILELKNSNKTFMFMQITSDGVRRQLVSEDYNDRRTDFYEQLLGWIDTNCEIDKVEEKLEIMPKLIKTGKAFEKSFMKMVVDNFFISSREKFRLISSDSSTLSFKLKSNIYNNLLNPEKYLTSFYSEKCNNDFYRFLLKSNYIGIDINFETLKNEFFDFITGKENYYVLALENLQFTIHNNPNVVNICIQFLKYIYLINSIALNDKNRYAHEILRSSIYGMPPFIIKQYFSNLKNEFKLLGDYYEAVLNEFDLVLKTYYNK
ncbi:MAG: hypothetical protein WA897_02920 [Moheibacter sp.]